MREGCGLLSRGALDCGMSPPWLVGPSEVEARPPHPAGPSSTGQVLALTLVALNVLLAAEAEAEMEARAIPEERIKAMRRMGNLALLMVPDIALAGGRGDGSLIGYGPDYVDLSSCSPLC
jgi:hypothetical protein